MKILKKIPWILIVIITFLIISITNGNTVSDSIQINLDGQKYDLDYNLSKGYIKYEGKEYTLLSDCKNEIIDITAGDIDSDGRDNLLILEGNKKSKYANDIVIYDLTNNNNNLQAKEIYRNQISVLKPWEIKTCDIDNNDELEIFIGVHKATKLYTKVENRPFFFNFRNNVLVKKWTGSKIRAPFTDVCFDDLSGNGSDEFIVIEEAGEDKFRVAVYYWFGFGFILQGESNIYNKIDSIKVVKNDKDTFIKAKVWKEGVEESIVLEPSEDKTENGVYLLSERRD